MRFCLSAQQTQDPERVVAPTYPSICDKTAQVLVFSVFLFPDPQEAKTRWALQTEDLTTAIGLLLS